MKSILLFALVCFFCLNANAGYSGIPSYSFQENVETGESATKMTECRNTIEAEKKKITSLGFKIVDESPCVTTNERDGKSLVRAYFHFLK